MRAGLIFRRSATINFTHLSRIEKMRALMTRHGQMRRETRAKARRFFETLPLADISSRREGETIILEGAGHRLEMSGEVVTYTGPNLMPRDIDPFDPMEEFTTLK